MARVLVAIPSGAKPIDAKCIEALWTMDRAGCETPLRIVEGYDCACARNAIAQLSLDLCCDKVLMVDGDVIVPRNALALLMEDGAPVVLGCYRRKDATGRTELFEDGAFKRMPQWSELPDGRFEVSGGGFGCALVDASVFRRLHRPYFAYTEYPGGGVLSEDLAFCGRVRGDGMRIEADGRVRCGHVGRHVYE